MSITDKVAALTQKGYTQEQAYMMVILDSNKMVNGGPYDPPTEVEPYNIPPVSSGLSGFDYGSQQVQNPRQQAQQVDVITPLQEETHRLKQNQDFFKKLSEEQPESELEKDWLQKETDNFMKENAGEDFTHQIPKAPEQGIYNPYGGVDLATAASYLGSSIEGGNTFGAVASGAKLLAGIGRKAFGAAGRQKRAEYVQNEYEEDMRDYYTQENSATYVGEDGGTKGKLPQAPSLTPYQNGGSKVDQTKLLTGEFITGVSPNNTSVKPNSEVEKNEHIVTPEGESMKVLGKTHEKGGENIELQEGDMVISDNLKLKGDNAKLLREKFDIKVKAKSTYAEAVDKIYKEIGLTKLIKEEEKILSRIKEEQKETKDGTTQSLNLQFLYKQRDKVADKKEKLEEERLKALKTVFTLQEQSKPVEDKNQEEEYQDGGPKLSPYAKLMFTGTPAQQAFARQNMSAYFNPEGEYYEANHSGESSEKHLEKMRPIFEKMVEEGMIDLENNEDTVEDKNPNLSPYAITMFTGTPEEKAQAEIDMAQYFNPEGDYYDANNKGESAEQHLERMRPIFEEMKSSGTLQDYIKDNQYVDIKTKYKDGGEHGDEEGEVTITKGNNPREFSNPKEQHFTSDKWSIAGSVNEENRTEVLMDLVGEFPEAVQANFKITPDGVIPRFEDSMYNLQKGMNEYYKSKKAEAKKKIKNPKELKRVLAAIDEQMFTGEGYKAKDGILGDFTASRRKIDFSILRGKKEPVKPEVVTTEEKEGESNFAFLPQQGILQPSAVAAQLKVNRRYDRVDPNLLSPEQIIQENQRQAQAAYTSIQGLSDSQRAAAVAQINANTQAANAKAIYQTEAANAQILNKAESKNAQIQMREEDMAANDALSFEKRQQTAQAITEEQIKQYYDYMRRLNTSKFNDIRRMNTINNIYDNYDINADGSIDADSDMTKERLWAMYKNKLITPTAPKTKK